MARSLVGGLSLASSDEALTTCVEELNEHLIRYSFCKAILWQVGQTKSNKDNNQISLNPAIKNHEGMFHRRELRSLC